MKILVNSHRALQFVLLLSLVSCNNPTQFKLIENPAALSSGVLFENTYTLKEWSTQFQLSKSEVNKTTVQFRVLDKQNHSQTEFPIERFSLLENNYPIVEYSLNKESTSTLKNVDVAFVFDVSGSMKKTINDAKLQIKKFVEESRDKGLAIRFCLITFGDYTLKQCNKFYDISKENPDSEKETKLFLNEIENLKAISGISDPGGNDLNENPLRAIIDASSAPWGSENQRFVVLMTDDGFLYSPGNTGAVGNMAPTFSEVLNKIDESKLRVFAATYNYPGYFSDFKLGDKVYNSIVKQSAGQWFDYGKLVSNEISLATIFNSIGVVVNTTFKVHYELDGHSALPNYLPLSKRNIRPQLDSNNLTINDVIVTSNLPNGSAAGEKQFKISSQKIKKNSVKVTLSGAPLYIGYFLNENQDLVFVNTAKLEGLLNISYTLDNPLEAFEINPINLFIKDSELKNPIVTINGIPVSEKFFTLVSQNTSSGRPFFQVKLNKEIFSVPNDLYSIEKLKRIDLKIQTQIDPNLSPI